MKHRLFLHRAARGSCAPAASRIMLAAVAAAAWALLNLQTGAAQTPPRPSNYYDVSADRSELKKIKGETVLELNDHVRVIHGDVTVTADRGLSYTERRMTQLFGNVRAVQQTMVMTGDEGEYMENEDLAVLRKNVHIIDRGWVLTCNEVRYSRLTGDAWLLGDVQGHDSTSTIKADRLLYQRLTERAEAFGNVEIADSAQDVIVYGDHGTYFRGHGEGVVDRNPRLVSGAKDPEPVTVISDTMRVYPDSSHATAYYRVNIMKGNMVTQCDSAMVYDDQKRVELFGHPLARQDNVWMKGSNMEAFYNEQEITRIRIEHDAEIREVPKDSLVVDRDNWMKGDDITLYLHNNDVDSVRVKGTAETEYHPVTPGKVERNQLTGDDLFMRFGANEVEWVDVKGNAAGTYRYIDLKKTETADSLRAVQDTTLKYIPFPGKSQRVDYAAEHIQYDANTRDLFLRKSAQVAYRGNELTGESITYHSSNQILDATGSPTLTEGGQKIYGNRMDYDMDSETGLVTEGSTRYEQGFYSGKDLAKVGTNEMKVWNSYYTTCDLKNPHYYFAAKTMKVYPDDKVFTGPIWLHVGKTPILALPFMANSISRGRRSGFLRPDFEFGITGNKSRFIRGLGYYWATNDYTDFTFVADYDEDVNWRMYISNRYALRYKFTGGVNYNYVRNVDGNHSEWTLDETHSQDLGERFSLNAGLRFVSSDNAPQSVNTIDNVNRYIDRSIRSNVSLRKSWRTTAFSASASRTQNLNITDPNATRVEMTAPDLQLSIPSRNLYFGSDTGAAKGFTQSLLKNTRYSPSLGGNYRRTEKLYETTDVMTGRAGLGLTSPQRLGFITVSPNISANLLSTRTTDDIRAHNEFTYTSTDTDTTYVAALNQTQTKSDFSWSMGASANTNFYGTFYPHVGRLRGIRHAVTPSVAYSFTPARSSSPRSQAVSLGLRNSLDLKVAGRDTTQSGEENVHKLSGVIIWSLSTQYRPDTNVNRAWSNISSSLNLNLLGINLSLNHTINPYERNVISTSATSGFRIGGTHPFGHASNVEVKELNTVAASDTARADRSGSGIDYTGRDEYGQAKKDKKSLELKEGRLPWELNLGLSYSKGSSGNISSTMRVGWDIQLTDNWRIDYSTIYDVEARELNGQNFGITRDLHCWEMSFARQELGDEWQYYFRITLKAHPDLYGESGTRGLGSGLMGQF
ncbi:MAG TPA: putative LPS assembly protein LptD [Candidatus Krumholzibacteria bacterium]|nr:putative LPS assembly protein LptD [Candidatus Krumholzibacteria bacterium]